MLRLGNGCRMLRPMIPLRFRTGRHTLNFFSIISTVGTPQTVTAEEIRIETMFPADDQSESVYPDFMSGKDIAGQDRP